MNVAAPVYNASANCLLFGGRLSVSFHRTLRIPDDGKTYPLPPGLGRFPLLRLDDRPGAEGQPTFVVPMYQREAMWIGFAGCHWKPSAVKVVAGGINAVTGHVDEGSRLDHVQDYLVCPNQPWLDGFNMGGGVVRQFVAMPLGQGYAVEASFGARERGGLDIVVFQPKPDRFPEEPPSQPPRLERLHMPLFSIDDEQKMAIGAGGRMRQQLVPDPYGVDTWDVATADGVRIELVNSTAFRALIGRDPPKTPIDAATYTAHGLPWFDLYDEAAASLPTARGQEIKTVRERERERDRERGKDQAETSIDVLPTQIKVVDPRPPSAQRGHQDETRKQLDRRKPPTEEEP